MPDSESEGFRAPEVSQDPVHCRKNVFGTSLQHQSVHIPGSSTTKYKNGLKIKREKKNLDAFLQIEQQVNGGNVDMLETASHKSDLSRLCSYSC